MTARWTLATLGAVAQVGAGNSAPQGDVLFADGTHPFFRTSDAGRVRFGDIEESSDYLNDVGIKGLRRFPAGTILFPKSGASTFLNHRVMLAVDGYVSSHLATIIGDEAKVNRRFLLYFLSTIFAQDLIQDHAYPSLNLPMIAGIPVMLPPLPEQQRIVTLLDEAFDGIATAKANAEKNLQNARRLFESYLQGIYAVRTGNFTKIRLEELCEAKRLITYGVIKLGDPFDDGVPCLRTSNVRWLHIDTTGMKRIAPSLSAEYGRTILRGDEVLVNVRGTLGGVAVVLGEMKGWNVSREVAVVPVNAKLLDPEFAAFWIGSSTSQEWLSGVKKGAAYTGINIEDLRNLPVPLPELTEQRAIVDAVLKIMDATQNMEAIYQQKLTALNELKKSILHRAFSGDL